MGLIFAALFTLGMALVLLFLWSLAASLKRDHAAAEVRRRREVRDAKLNAELHRAGAPLRCLSCGARFPGPLGARGCPECRLESLVVPENEAPKTQTQEDTW